MGSFTKLMPLPITHTKPPSPDEAKEIPHDVKKRLGLDHEKSWIITTELNRFTWTGPDIRRTPSGEFAYGYLSPGLTKKTRDQIQSHSREKRMAIIDRDEKPKKKV